MFVSVLVLLGVIGAGLKLAAATGRIVL